MNPLFLVFGGAALFTTAFLLRKASEAKSSGGGGVYMPSGAIEQAIASEASRQGVDPKVAIAFARVESGMKPGSIGDRAWPERVRGDGRTNHQALVLGNAKFNNNPYRNQPELWVSYGLFQLLAVYSLDSMPDADPRILLNPATNIRLGVAKIKMRLDQYGGDVLKARIAYKCGSATGCSDDVRASAIARFEKAASDVGLVV